MWDLTKIVIYVCQFELLHLSFYTQAALWSGRTEFVTLLQYTQTESGMTVKRW
jgi:hypothetical protein